MTTRFVTVHVLLTLGLHNLNRDGNGLPKSQVDGGVQRARLSSQSIKRAARQLYRQAGHEHSVRTKHAALEITRRVLRRAQEEHTPVDRDAVADTAVLAVRSLYTGTGKTGPKELKQLREKLLTMLPSDLATLPTATEETESPTEPGADPKDTLVFLSEQEIDAFASAIYHAQTNGDPLPTQLVKDATSDALDIAAFGRMFAQQQALGTHAAVAVSHASTVHRMQLVTDYFTAVEDLSQGSAGAAHIAESYFTSGTYYRTFTIDVDQLARSWSAFDQQGSRQAVADLVRALVLALPGGKVNATNAATLPLLVLAETQAFRVAYGFDTPIPSAEHGGYGTAAVAELARQRRQALTFDPALFGPAQVTGDVGEADFAAEQAAGLDELVDFVVTAVYEGR